MANLDIDFTRRNKKPRPLSEMEKEKLEEFIEAIHYSARCVEYGYISMSRRRSDCKGLQS
jgi:cyclin-dependent kinase regulatory subunit CKS1